MSTETIITDEIRQTVKAQQRAWKRKFLKKSVPTALLALGLYAALLYLISLIYPAFFAATDSFVLYITTIAFFPLVVYAKVAAEMEGYPSIKMHMAVLELKIMFDRMREQDAAQSN